MSSVTDPEAGDVIRRCGLSAYLTGDTDEDFATLLGDFIGEASDWVALRVGEARFDGSAWTDRQASVLSAAISYQAGAMFLMDPVAHRATGTQQPLLQEDAEQIAALIELNEAQAAERVRQILSGQSGDEDVPFARPAFGSSTFAPSGADRPPDERNRLRDESDNIASEDTARG